MEMIYNENSFYQEDTFLIPNLVDGGIIRGFEEIYEEKMEELVKLTLNPLTSLETFSERVENYFERKSKFILKENDFNLIHLSVIVNRPEFVKFLLSNFKYFVNVNKSDGNGETPLHLACWLGERFEIVQILIENSANVNLVDSEGESPIFMSVRKQDYKTVKFLLKRGARVDVRNSRGEFPSDTRKADIFLQNVLVYYIPEKIKSLKINWEETFTEMKLDYDVSMEDCERQNSKKICVLDQLVFEEREMQTSLKRGLDECRDERTRREKELVNIDQKIVDREKEREGLTKEIKRLEKLHKALLKKKINQKFPNNGKKNVQGGRRYSLSPSKIRERFQARKSKTGRARRFSSVLNKRVGKTPKKVLTRKKIKTSPKYKISPKIKGSPLKVKRRISKTPKKMKPSFRDAFRRFDSKPVRRVGMGRKVNSNTRLEVKTGFLELYEKQQKENSEIEKENKKMLENLKTLEEENEKIESDWEKERNLLTEEIKELRLKFREECGSYPELQMIV